MTDMEKKVMVRLCAKSWQKQNFTKRIRKLKI